MLISLRSIAVVLTALATLPLAACGSSVSGTGGGGGTGGNDTTTSSSTSTSGSGTCVDYCGALLACTDASTCVLVDAAATQAACEASCAAGFAVLTPAESNLVKGCLDCVLGLTEPGTCFEDLPFTSCKAECDTPAVEAAGEKWSDAAQPAPSGTAGLCTNGKNVLANSECGGSGDGTSCTVECCNGPCGTTPDVGVACTPDVGPATCTCTAGKNQGKTFSTSDPCNSDDLWNECNL